MDGLRHPLDFENLHKTFPDSFHLLFIDSPPQTRFARLNQKGKYGDFASFEAADSHPVEQHINAFREKASVIIHNERSFESFYAAVDEAVCSFRKEG